MVDASTKSGSSPNPSDWFSSFGQQSKLMLATIDPVTLTIENGNDAFTRLVGFGSKEGEWQEKALQLRDLFSDFDEAAQKILYRRHLLRAILRDVGRVAEGDWRFLDEPVVATLKSPSGQEPRYIEFWLRSDRLNVERIDPQLDEFAELDLSQVLSQEIVSEQMWEERIQWSNYRVTGQLLWEGLDITSQEQMQRAIAAAISQDSIFEPESFAAMGEHLRSLFRADKHLLLGIKQEQIQVSIGCGESSQHQRVYSFDSLNESHFFRAAKANRVWNVPDLQEDCPTELERMLLEQDVRSLLLIPLLHDEERATESIASSLLGFVAVASDCPNHFDRLDADRATALIPAFKAAFRQSAQERFTRIHPAVEWRFRQEAERRRLGLPPERIVFTDVYPMYGLSDVRGSSHERNLAIKTDLLEQFRLALAIIEAVKQEQHIGFLDQLQLDLQLYVDRLSREIKVEDEVTAVDYLKNHLEVYFDYFRQCGPKVIDAVDTYQSACDNEQGSVYQARESYDRALNEINAHLRDTWERWQAQMQQILPHYCDMEVTDGIDHILYAGASLNQDREFSQFHLHSLRYDQLRAVCDCARTCLKLHEQLNSRLEVSHLVLAQNITVDIFHDEKTEKLFDVRGTRDTRYEIVKKRIDKARDAKDGLRITQPGMLTVVYSTNDEWTEYHQYLRYLVREGWTDCKIDSGAVEPLQGVTGLKYARVRILPEKAQNAEG